MKKIILVIIILLALYGIARYIKNQSCLNMPLSEAFEDQYCKNHWSDLYG